MATLITIALMAMLGVVLMTGSFTGSSGVTQQKGTPGKPGSYSKSTTIPGRVRDRAKDYVCQSNIVQLRQSIAVYQTTADDTPPTTLEDTKLGSQFYRCPVGKEPYAYDQATGKVRCVHPGHENF